MLADYLHSEEFFRRARCARTTASLSVVICNSHYDKKYALGSRRGTSSAKENASTFFRLCLCDDLSRHLTTSPWISMGELRPELQSAGSKARIRSDIVLTLC